MVFFKFILISILYFLQFNIHAQEIDYGLKGGATMGTPYSKPKEGDSGKPGTGIVLGGFLNYTFSKHFGIHTELTCSHKNASFKTHVSGDTLYAEEIAGATYYIPTKYDGWVNGKFKDFYIDLPVSLRYKLSKLFDLLAGLQISYLYKGGNTGTADVAVGADPVNYPYTIVKDRAFDESDQLNKWDYGVICGTNFEASKRLNFNLNCAVGLRSIYKKTYTQVGGIVRNIYLQFATTYQVGRIKNNSDIEKRNTKTQ